MKFSFGARSDVGLARQYNEDSYLVDEELGLFVVADGMGGTKGGEVASRMACDEIHRYVLKHKSVLERFSSGVRREATKEVMDVLDSAIQKACSRVFETAQENAELGGMGTTVVLLLLGAHHGFIAHVGDSRAYLMRGGRVHQMTRDHSLVEELRKLGKITASDQVKCKYRNAITRAVGVYENVQVDFIDLVPMPQDRFVLCSDGFHSTAGEEELPRLLSEDSPDMTAENLIRHANSKGGRDNITTVLVDVESVEEEQVEKTQRKIATLKSVPMFKYLTFDELLRVVSELEEISFAKGHTILHEDEPGDSLYVLLAGEVDISRKSVSIARLKTGDHFGELSLIDTFPRSATVTAISTSLCLVMSRSRFYEVIRKYDALSVKLLWSISRVCCSRLRQTTDELGLARSLVAQVSLEEHEEGLFEEVVD